MVAQGAEGARLRPSLGGQHWGIGGTGGAPSSHKRRSVWGCWGETRIPPPGKEGTRPHLLARSSQLFWVPSNLLVQLPLTLTLAVH